eukprot:CAMPEP_0185845130 /NCGR_PEP_ID=MMETSP1354-20130828/1184_1 /TAXON_ID=708628 /ORGANISM="Erythrolobus madagascarensis, Strain CCMP3276" /LENGTH=403 /DNA_ID=CAMNT_0028545025 /DNA_START=104 /DNA_END=1315 /DNA_ORIENTATION=-
MGAQAGFVSVGAPISRTWAGNGGLNQSRADHASDGLRIAQSSAGVSARQSQKPSVGQWSMSRSGGGGKKNKNGSDNGNNKHDSQSQSQSRAKKFSVAENALYDFLTKRSVKTLMVYLDEFHDGPSKDWLEKFADFKQREATFAESDKYLLRMMRTTTQKGTLTVSHPKGYFKRSFPFTIEPRRLAERILAIREQLAAEWQRDLQLIEEENQQLHRIHLELSLNGADTDLNKVRKRIFEHDPFADNDSALCSSNYRQLKAMLTEFASYAFLDKLKHVDSHSYKWLDSYLSTHEVGNDEAFLRELWTMPTVSPSSSSEETDVEGEVRPFDLAGKILSERLKLSKDWSSLLTNAPSANRVLLLECLKESVGGIGEQEVKVLAKRDPQQDAADGSDSQPTPDGSAQP